MRELTVREYRFCRSLLENGGDIGLVSRIFGEQYVQRCLDDPNIFMHTQMMKADISEDIPVNKRKIINEFAAIALAKDED